MDNDFLDDSYNEDEYGDLLFYTPKMVQQIDDAAILEEIFTLYPKLKLTNNGRLEKEDRRVFAEFLNEKKLVDRILQKYNLSIIELVKLFYRKYTYLFNTITYSKKLKKIIEANAYPTESKK